MISRRTFARFPSWLGRRQHPLPFAGSPASFSDSPHSDNDPPASSDTKESPKSGAAAAKPKSKLMTVVAGMRVQRSASATSSPISRDSPEGSARPQQRSRPDVKEESRSDQEDVKARVHPQLLAAVDEVAEALSPAVDSSKTKSELVGILVEHATRTAEARNRAPGALSNLLAGMKIDRTRSKPDAGSPAPPSFGFSMDQAFDMAQQPMRAMMEPYLHDQEKLLGGKQHWGDRPPRQEKSSFQPERVNIFGEEPLGVFTNIPALMASKPKVELKTWDALEKEELHKLLQQPPKNAFEEMARWTKQGKLWRFPINNEQDFFREENVDFTEHIFLEHLIADFPQKGPIKQFMDVVLYALSCNPYISVAEKHDHVDWFREWFKEKRSVLTEVMPAELCDFVEREPLEAVAAGEPTEPRHEAPAKSQPAA
ncbi:putative 28S ribosomal protein S31, mitochondrial [Hypsibius exemplaris]|uniref:Small ribosomal subunit protein mS31 n=1 Tax=Hypsibius exemplaris TaxID=2072580 RepID=A0A1W0X7T1_HYPEX|nr:putative 28S ribosomal protein S31, mitochondrial [Hypsibius exemplaris]